MCRYPGCRYQDDPGLPVSTENEHDRTFFITTHVEFLVSELAVLPSAWWMNTKIHAHHTRAGPRCTHASMHICRSRALAFPAMCRVREYLYGVCTVVWYRMNWLLRDGAPPIP